MVEVKSETMTIYGRTISVRTEYKPVETLRLDPDNPRMRHETYIKGRILSELELEEEIWKEDRTKRLYQSVLSSRGIQNPLLITEEGRVVEGNRRTVVSRKLKERYENGSLKGAEKEIAPAIFNKVPCKILPPDITPLEIDVLLLREHIAGKDPWPAVNQAEHIYRLSNDRGFPVEKIAEISERSKPWVYQKLKAFEWTKDFLDNHKDKAKLQDYSFFEELYKQRTALRKKAGFDVNDIDDMEYFHGLILKKRIKMAIDVRKLPEILSHPAAKETLEKDGMDKAWIVVQSIDPKLGSPTFAALATALEKLRKMPRYEYEGTKENKPQQALLYDLKNEIERILNDLGL